MKKISLFLAVFILFGMTACNNGNRHLSGESDTESERENRDGESNANNDASDTSVREEPSETVSEELSEESKYIDGKKLVAFGDSITALGSWGRDAAKVLNMYFFNGAMGGITSAQGIERFDAYVATQNPDFVTILFGMNDLIMVSPNTPRVSPEKFGENLRTLVSKVLSIGAKPILLTANPLNPNTFYSAQGQDRSWYSEVGDPLEWLDVYNEVTRSVAKETGTSLIDMRKACEGMSYQTLLTDGIHLASKGNEIFKSYLTAWFHDNYQSDPNSVTVSEEDKYINVTEEGGNVAILSYEKEDWYTVDAKLMLFREVSGGGIKLSNTNGLWPEAHCLPDAPVCISVENGVLNYDISNANVSSSIVIYFDGATPSAYTEGQYVVINRFIGGDSLSSVGDLLGNKRFKGSVRLSELGISSSVIHDGKLVITGVKVFVAGNAYEGVTIRELSVSID